MLSIDKLKSVDCGVSVHKNGSVNVAVSGQRNFDVIGFSKLDRFFKYMEFLSDRVDIYIWKDPGGTVAYYQDGRNRLEVTLTTRNSFEKRKIEYYKMFVSSDRRMTRVSVPLNFIAHKRGREYQIDNVPALVAEYRVQFDTIIKPVPKMQEPEKIVPVGATVLTMHVYDALKGIDKLSDKEIERLTVQFVETITAKFIVTLR